jgi:hypothetical protein
MKKTIIIILLMFPIIVKAQCSNQEMTKYKTLAGNITSSYEYNQENNTFTAIIGNVHSDLYLRDTTNNNEYRPANPGINEIRISNLEPGKNKKITIQPQNSGCSSFSILTLYITPPYYNKYYTDPICENNDNKLCSKWANTEALSYEKFVETIKNTTEEQIQEEQEPELEEKKYSFLEFLADYYIVILLTIIILGSISIYKIDKKNKFDF